MKVYKYLFSVIVMLGLISCSSEESDFENDVVSTVGQYTVAFNLSNDITTKAAGEIGPVNGEADINEFVLFICDKIDGRIIQRGYFKGNKSNTCTFNFKPIAGQVNYYAYAVANAGQLNSVTEESSVADLKNATASIPTDGADASNLPKMGGMPFEIDLEAISSVQPLGTIPVFQLVSGLRLQIRTNFVGGTDPKFVVRDIKWNNFSAEGKIGGDNTNFIKGNLSDVDSNYYISVNSDEFINVGSGIYTFPNIVEDAVLYVEGDICDGDQIIEEGLDARIIIGTTPLAANTKYNVQLTVNGTLSKDTQISLNYEVLEAESITVDVPAFE